MNGVKSLSFGCLLIFIIFTVFYMQNRVNVPVRYNFSEPVLFSLPLLVLLSFTGGLFYSLFLYLFSDLISKGGDSPASLKNKSAQNQNLPSLSCHRSAPLLKHEILTSAIALKPKEITAQNHAAADEKKIKTDETAKGIRDSACGNDCENCKKDLEKLFLYTASNIFKEKTHCAENQSAELTAQSAINNESGGQLCLKR